MRQIPNFFQLRFPKYDLKKSRLCHIWGLIWTTLDPNVTFLYAGLTFWKFAILMSKNSQKLSFFPKNDNFEKKGQSFWQFLTFKWQISGGSDAVSLTSPVDTVLSARKLVDVHHVDPLDAARQRAEWVVLTGGCHELVSLLVTRHLHLFRSFTWVSGVLLWPKVGQIGLKWDKSGTCSVSQSVWNLIWQSPGFVQFGVQSDPLWCQTYHPWQLQLT